MLERLITPELSRDVVTLLVRKRGWSISRIARTTKAPLDFVRRVKAGRQSFLLNDLEALGRACRQNAHMLVFDSMSVRKLPAELQGLYELGVKEIGSHKEFKRAMRRGAKKRPQRPKAA